MHAFRLQLFLVTVACLFLGCGNGADDPGVAGDTAAHAAERPGVGSESTLSPSGETPAPRPGAGTTARPAARRQGLLEPAFEELSVGLPRGNFAAVDMGDVDQDGYAEIVSGRRDGGQGLVLFSHDGEQWVPQQITGSGEYGGVVLADVTGDGVLDVLAAKTVGRPSGLEIHSTQLSEGRMRFTALPSPFTDAACDDVAVGDIEADGDIDVAVSTGGRGVQVLVNDGKAAFRRIGLATDNYEDTGIAFGDLNGDSRLDLVASNHPGNNLRVFLCSATGAVSYAGPYTEGLTVSPGIGYRMTIADYDGDRFNDIAVGTEAGMRLYRGNGCKGAASGWWRPGAVPDRGSQTMQVSARDLNNDGKPDLAFSSAAGIYVLLGRGTEGFSQRLALGLPDRGEFSGCCLFDWDGDGDLDLACSSLQGLGVRFYRNAAAGR